MVILFGSYAKGRATMGSDIDLVVVRETDRPLPRRGDDIRPLLATSLVRVDLHVFTPDEMEEYGTDPSSFVGSVLATGRVVFHEHSI